MSPGNSKKMSKKLIFTAVNAVTSAQMLKLVPHRILCDGLAIVYRYVESDGRFSNVISNKVAFELGLTEPQLYGIALENLKHYLPILKEEEEGVFTISSLTGSMIGSSLALMPGMLDRLLNKTGEERLYVTVEPEKVTVATRVAAVFARCLKASNRVGRIMTYSRNGFALI